MIGFHVLVGGVGIAFKHQDAGVGSLIIIVAQCARLFRPTRVNQIDKHLSSGGANEKGVDLFVTCCRVRGIVVFAGREALDKGSFASSSCTNEGDFELVNIHLRLYHVKKRLDEMDFCEQ